ncbi:urease accessory protein UreE [Ferrovibrio terrae]|uniref:urease accessory protein UreE n=1 Tax=Ferrovibrio terrae TaxID=2594003 RepID=UPI003138222F
MLRAATVISATHWPAAERRATVTLAHHDRHRRRIRLTADDGTAFLLDLAEATVLRHGDGLKLDDGGYIEVQAAPEQLIEVSAPTPELLARLAWHLGNRHLPAEIRGDRILIRDDHVIVDMLKGLGASVAAVNAPFDPEGGAYGQHNHDPSHPFGLGSRYGKGGEKAGGHSHDHDHGHGHGHHHHHHGDDHDHHH